MSDEQDKITEIGFYDGDDDLNPTVIKVEDLPELLRVRLEQILEKANDPETVIVDRSGRKVRGGTGERTDRS